MAQCGSVTVGRVPCRKGGGVRGSPNRRFGTLVIEYSRNGSSLRTPEPAKRHVGTCDMYLTCINIVQAIRAQVTLFQTIWP